MSNILIMILIFICSFDASFLTYEDQIPLKNIVIYDNAIEIERLLYGDLTKMDDLFLPPLEGEGDADDVDEKDSTEEKLTRHFNFDYIDTNTSSLGIKEFNDVTKSLRNYTRRWYGYFEGYQDPQDPKWLKEAYDTEEDKRNKMQNMNMQWLMHARFQIKKVLVKKNTIREDARYRIGYLVNRLKRLKFEQQKLVSYAADEDKNTEYRNLWSQIKLYERMVRYDVDITDTVKLIKDLDMEADRVETVDVPVITTPNG